MPSSYEKEYASWFPGGKAKPSIGKPSRDRKKNKSAKQARKRSR